MEEMEEIEEYKRLRDALTVIYEFQTSIAFIEALAGMPITDLKELRDSLLGMADFNASCEGAITDTAWLERTKSDLRQYYEDPSILTGKEDKNL